MCTRIRHRISSVFGLSIAVALALTVTASTNLSNAALCPFCSAVALTFSEQLDSNDVVVVAKLLEIPAPLNDPDADFPKAKFEIVRVVKGDKFVGTGMKFRTQLVGNYPEGQKFLVMGVDPPKLAWTTPMKASETVFRYLGDIQELPEKGADRLDFFQDYFEHDESILAFDAYDEFARAPYEDLIALKDRMHHDKLIAWIQNPETSVNRRRLYFTMLGVCGTDGDVKILEELIKSGDRKKRAGLDALIACYLNLKGESGVDLIEETFLVDKEVDYVDTLAAVMALRFHGTEVEIVSKERIVSAIRHLLDRPKMADMIIPDLARWEDWSVMERLVQMFKDADDETNWLRVPVISYLRACPKPEAKVFIDELAKIDPDAVRRADFFLGGFDDDEDDEDDEDDDDDDDDDEGDDDDQGDDDDTGTEADGTATEETEKQKDSIESSPSVEIETKSPGEDTDNGDIGLADLSRPDTPVQVQSKSDVYEVSTSSVPTTDQRHRVKKQPIEQSASPAAGTFATQQNVQEKPEISATETVRQKNNVAVALNKGTSVNPADSSSVTSQAGKTTDHPGQQVARTVPPEPPIASVAPGSNLTWFIVFIPMGVSVVIFLLLWSVVNGWFERLIF